MTPTDRILYPDTGCLVEFMHGNSPTLGIITEVQSGRLRLYTQHKRETVLPASRLLPWSGPAYGSGLSRQTMDTLLEEHHLKREQERAHIDVLALWDLLQGEVQKAGCSYMAELLWQQPSIDQEAALGRALLAHKSHFRFTGTDFDIFPAATVTARQQELEAQQIRDAILQEGASFFKQLWDVFQHRQQASTLPELRDEATAQHLRHMLRARIADPACTDDETLWKQLTKGLPDQHYLAVCLASAWGLIPPHYNYLLQRADIAQGTSWAEPFQESIAHIRAAVQADLAQLPCACTPDKSPMPFITIDPASTIDRDDAFAVTRHADGSYSLAIAIASPGLYWPFDSELDKAVLHRASSIYLPEGDEHMLPPACGWELFSLDAHQPKAALVCHLHLDAQGQCLHMEAALQHIICAANLSLEEAEASLQLLAATQDLSPEEQTTAEMHALWATEPESTTEPAANSATAVAATAPTLATRAAAEHSSPALHNSTSVQNEPQGQASAHKDAQGASAVQEAAPTQQGASAHARMLEDAYALALLLQQQRVLQGAIITQRPLPELLLSGYPHKVRVDFSSAPQTPLSHCIISEFMVLANTQLAQWAQQQHIPLLYRTQDVNLPPSHAGVWTTPHDIAKVVKSLPPAGLDTLPKKHAGLGAPIYATCTAPIRRYIDLFNQGQMAHYLRHGTAALPAGKVQELLPLISQRSDAAGAVQHMRPRYWKLVYFLQQGPTLWWEGVVTEESPYYITVTLPFAQIYLRGKRSLFTDKMTRGQPVAVRIGKVNPLCNEIQVLEVKEATGQGK